MCYLKHFDASLEDDIELISFRVPVAYQSRRAMHLGLL